MRLYGVSCQKYSKGRLILVWNAILYWVRVRCRVRVRGSEGGELGLG